MNHPLFQGTVSLRDADAVLVLEANVPWMPGPNAPGPDAWIAVVDHDPAKLRYPTYEFTAQRAAAGEPAARDPRHHRGGGEAAGRQRPQPRRRPGAEMGRCLARAAAQGRGGGAGQGQEHPGRSDLDQLSARPGARRQLPHHRRFDALAAPQHFPVDVEAGLLLPQSRQQRRLGAGRGPGRQDRRTRPRCRARQRRRVLAVRRVQRGDLVGGASPRAVPRRGVPEPQLHHRHASASPTPSARTATRPSTITRAAISIRRSISPRKPRPRAPMARTCAIRPRSARRSAAAWRRSGAARRPSSPCGSRAFCTATEGAAPPAFHAVAPQRRAQYSQAREVGPCTSLDISAISPGER